MKSLHNRTIRLVGILLAATLAFTTAAWAGKGKISIAGMAAATYTHIWVTVTEIDFHTSNAAPGARGGWLKYPLTTPVTIDLAATDGTGITSLWEGLNLPTGSYQMIRIVTATNSGELAPSAAQAGLLYNNQVDAATSTGTTSNPLRVVRGSLNLAGTFSLTDTDDLNIAISVDPSHQVVRAGFMKNVTYMLKPVLTYVDLNAAGAITGKLAFTNLSSASGFVVKAEQVKTTDAGAYRVVKRTATVKSDGTFTVAPVAPGSYDLVIRGRNAETFIVTGVPVIPSTTADIVPTDLGPAIEMVPGTEYDVTAKASPSSASVNLYQTLPDDPAPYAIRYRQVNPLSGTFSTGLAVSAGPLHVGAFNNGEAITFAAVSPAEGDGAFLATAEAPAHDRSAYLPVSSSAPSVDFGTLALTAPAVPRQASGTIVIPSRLAGKINQGALLAVRDGVIVDAVDISAAMPAGGTFAMPNLPGGTPEQPLTTGVYNLYAIGWNSATPKKITSFGMSRAVNVGTADVLNLNLRMMGGWKMPSLFEVEN